MIRVIMNGCNGKMGQVISGLVAADPAVEMVAGIDRVDNKVNPYPVFTDIKECDVEADVIIDFSVASAVDALLDYCVEKNLPCVLCTTGLSQEQLDKVAESSKKVAILKSANMSLGINLLLKMVKEAAALLAPAGFDMEIVEKHHNQKLDVPSGTALLLAHRIQEALTDTVLLVGRHENGKRTAKEIGIHSLRLGNEVGTHEIIIATGAETITLKHEAENRSLFANGALAAIKFLEGKPAGLYSMQDII